MLRADLTLLLHTQQVTAGACLLLPTARLLLSTAYRLLFAYRLPACLLSSPTSLLAIVNRLPALHAGAALAIAQPCCRRDPSTHMTYGITFAIAYPRRIRECLPMLALHINVYALFTPPPGSISRLSQPPLQRMPSVVDRSPWQPIRQPTACSPCLPAPG